MVLLYIKDKNDEEISNSKYAGTEIVEYLEENGLYYQLYTDKGVYVPDYG